MKIKAIAAAGAIGLGIGFAGLITAGTASADECGADNDPPVGPIGTGKIICNIQSNGSSFFMSVSPLNNAQILLFGTQDADGNPDGLGLVDQPTTFMDSVVGRGLLRRTQGPRRASGAGGTARTDLDRGANG